jgi:hypothetical protein
VEMPARRRTAPHQVRAVCGDRLANRQLTCELSHTVVSRDDYHQGMNEVCVVSVRPPEVARTSMTTV